MRSIHATSPVTLRGFGLRISLGPLLVVVRRDGGATLLVRGAAGCSAEISALSHGIRLRNVGGCDVEVEPDPDAAMPSWQLVVEGMSRPWPPRQSGITLPAHAPTRLRLQPETIAFAA